MYTTAQFSGPLSTDGYATISRLKILDLLTLSLNQNTPGQVDVFSPSGQLIGCLAPDIAAQVFTAGLSNCRAQVESLSNQEGQLVLTVSVSSDPSARPQPAPVTPEKTYAFPPISLASPPVVVSDSFSALQWVIVLLGGFIYNAVYTYAILLNAPGVEMAYDFQILYWQQWAYIIGGAFFTSHFVAVYNAASRKGMYAKKGFPFFLECFNLLVATYYLVELRGFALPAVFSTTFWYFAPGVYVLSKYGKYIARPDTGETKPKRPGVTLAVVMGLCVIGLGVYWLVIYQQTQSFTAISPTPTTSFNHFRLDSDPRSMFFASDEKPSQYIDISAVASELGRPVPVMWDAYIADVDIDLATMDDYYTILLDRKYYTKTATEKAYAYIVKYSAIYPVHFKTIYLVYWQSDQAWQILILYYDS